MNRFRICAWIETSSALTGSSQTMNFGSHGQRPGDADPLPLPAGELVRIAVVCVRVHAHLVQELEYAVLFVLAFGQVVDAEGFADDAAHGHAGVERGIGVLENDLHVLCACAAIPRHPCP